MCVTLLFSRWLPLLTRVYVSVMLPVVNTWLTPAKYHHTSLSFFFSFSSSCVQLKFLLASSWCITCTHFFLFLLFRCFFHSFIFPSFTVSYHSITHCEREECKEEDPPTVSHLQHSMRVHSFALFSIRSVQFVLRNENDFEGGKLASQTFLRVNK